MSIVRASARRMIGADGIAIILREAGHCHYIEEDAIGPLWRGQRFPVDECVSGWAMLRGQTAVIPDVFGDRRVPRSAYLSTFVRSMAMAPMGDAVASGAVGAYWAEARQPDAEAVAVLEQLALAAGAALIRCADAHSEPAPKVGRGLSFKLSPQLLLKIVPDRPVPVWQGHALAILAVCAIAIVRLSIWPIMGSAALFTGFLPAIMLATLWAGWRPAMTALILSSAAAAGFIGWKGDGAELVTAGAALLYLSIGLLVVGISVLARERLSRQVDQRDILEIRDGNMARVARELDHRNRNTLAVAASLARFVARSSSSATEMADRLASHFSAMTEAQGRLVSVGDQGLPVGEMLTLALKVFEKEGRLTVHGAEGAVCPTGCEVMFCLAMQELGTNSSKYGAFSMADGKVEVDVRQNPASVELRWVESGGPRVEAPQAFHNGTRLIERALSGAPGGEVSIAYLPAGVVVLMRWDVK